MKVRYPKLYSMAHLLTLNVLLLPKDLTIIFNQDRAQKRSADGWMDGQKDTQMYFLEGIT